MKRLLGDGVAFFPYTFLLRFDSQCNRTGMFPQGVNIALGLSYMLCTLLQIVGFGTPAWVVSDYNGEIFDSCGLLFCVSCRNGSGCETKTYLQTYQEYNTADGGMWSYK